MKFNKLTVISRAESRINKGGQHRTMWRCLCDCGNYTDVYAYGLKTGKTKSCGCYKEQIMSEVHFKHGGTKDNKRERLYTVWRNMLSRCNNPNFTEYNIYGGRGIRVCDEWKDYASFREWALGAGYDDSAKRGELTIDRIDGDGNYCPENCCLKNQKEQARNRRTNRTVTIGGVSRCLLEWCEEYNMPYKQVHMRITRLGWDPVRALTTAIRPMKCGERSES